MDVVKRIEEKGVNLKIIRPNPEDQETLWMDELIKDLHRIAVDAFGKWLPYEAIDGRTRESELICVLSKEGRRVGYTVNELHQVNGLKANVYGSALLRREIQGLGLYKDLNLLRAQLVPSDALVTRTQNPIVHDGFDKLCQQLEYEMHPSGVEIPPQAVEIARGYSPGADSNLIVPGVYFGRSLMNDTPEPRTEEQRKIWRKIDIDKGDAVVLVGLPHGIS